MRLTSSKSVLLLGLVLWTTPAFCQIPQVNASKGVPVQVLYDFFFTRVMWLEDQADKAVAQGKDDKNVRHLIQVQCGLTTQQELSLKAIASDWRAKNAALLGRIRSLAEAGARGRTSPELQALHAEREQLVQDHVSQLQKAYGPGLSYVLDLFIRRTTDIRGSGITPAAVFMSRPSKKQE